MDGQVGVQRDGLVVVRGAGDLATGTIVRLVRCGFPVVALEIDRPTTIRRTVALSEAVYEGRVRVEDVEARLAREVGEALDLASGGAVALLVDPTGATLQSLRPAVLVDAIIAKRNTGTRRGMAPVVIGLGPGFTAGVDVDAVVETNRGHDLGRVILEGSAEPDTRLPGNIGGETARRVLRASSDGEFVALCDIGDRVEEGQAVAAVEGEERTEVRAQIGGIVRGLLRPGLRVWADFKVGDVDPRGEREHCFTVSDKSRAIGGAVLEAILLLSRSGA